MDPLKGTVREISSMNQYIYVSNSPLVYVDPLGLVKIAGIEMHSAVNGKIISSYATDEAYISMDEVVATLIVKGYGSVSVPASPIDFTVEKSLSGFVYNYNSTNYIANHITSSTTYRFPVISAVGADKNTYYFVKASCLDNVFEQYNINLDVTELDTMFNSNTRQAGIDAANAIADSILYTQYYRDRGLDAIFNTSYIKEFSFWSLSNEYNSRLAAWRAARNYYSSKNAYTNILGLTGTVADYYKEGLAIYPDLGFATLYAMARGMVESILDPDGAYIDPANPGLGDIGTMVGSLIDYYNETTLGQEAYDSVKAYLEVSRTDRKYLMLNKANAGAAFNELLMEARHKERYETYGNVLTQFIGEYLGGFETRIDEIYQVNIPGNDQDYSIGLSEEDIRGAMGDLIASDFYDIAQAPLS